MPSLHREDFAITQREDTSPYRYRSTLNDLLPFYKTILLSIPFPKPAI